VARISLHFATFGDQKLPKSDLHPSPVHFCNEYGAPIAPPSRSSHAREAASLDSRVRILPPQPVRSLWRSSVNTGKRATGGKRASKSSVSCCLPPYANVHYRQRCLNELESATRRQGGRWSGFSSRIVFLLTRPSPAIRRCAGTAVGEVDPLDLVETIREGVLVLDPDRTVRFAHRSFGE
jgi:hypothetical protein